MTERYSIAKDSILEGCLVTPDVYKGIFERFENFVTPYVEHLHKRVQRRKAVDYMKGWMSDSDFFEMPVVRPTDYTTQAIVPRIISSNAVRQTSPTVFKH